MSNQTKTETLFHENGQKQSEGEYKNGKQNGHWIGWYANGQKSKEGGFKNGKQEGLWTSWYENGRKKARANSRTASRSAFGPRGTKTAGRKKKAS